MKHKVVISRSGKVVRVEFSSRNDAIGGTDSLRIFFDHAMKHRVAFETVVDSFNEGVSRFIQARNDERGFRKFLARQKKPSGVS